LKLVSGAIRTMAISASAITGDALVDFESGMTKLLRKEFRYTRLL